MEQGNTPNSTGLENQLRTMILENVNITPARANHGGQSTQHGRGRGRARAGFSGSSNFHNQNHVDQGQGWRTNAHVPTALSRGRGRGYTPGQHQGQRQIYPQQNAQVQRGPGLLRNGSSTDTNGQPVTRTFKHPQHANSAGQAISMPPYHPRPQYAPQPQIIQPPEDTMAQVEHLDKLAAQEIPAVEMSPAEANDKEKFRKYLEEILQQAFAKEYSRDVATITLVGFGSLASGFGMPGSDMDLAVVLEFTDASKVDGGVIDRHVPRLLERAVLDAKLGGRCLTKTRVPILKICQKPTDALYDALLAERRKWDELSGDEKGSSKARNRRSPAKIEEDKHIGLTAHTNSSSYGDDFPGLGTGPTTKAAARRRPKHEPREAKLPTSATNIEEVVGDVSPNTIKAASKEQNRRPETVWRREKVMGPLDFPKSGVGFQVDINFGNPLGIYNTHLLRCYSLTDPRVRPIVLFVKSWAKRRKINSAYSGTLSSYGWVLMVLHYLVNIAQPPVCPNLQHSSPQPKELPALEAFFNNTTVSGYAVHFWRNEQEIMEAAQSGKLSQNQQSIGALLRGFFQYYAGPNPGYNYGPRLPQFHWMNDVLSLRTLGGILKKQTKGWIGATTKVTAEKKVTNRYLFAIEDPFEVDHNVARTVTHRGIVAIRDEFRRAWQILKLVGQGASPNEHIFDELPDEVPPSAPAVEEKTEQQTGTQEDLGAQDPEHPEDVGQAEVVEE